MPATLPADPQVPTCQVLVVDDAAEMRAYMGQCLRGLPVHVAEAADGQRALDWIRSRADGEVALVLTDVVMPELDGYGLKAALQADPRWADVPVVLVSGEAIPLRE